MSDTDTNVVTDRRRGRRPWLIAGAASAVLATAVGVFVSRDSEPPPPPPDPSTPTGVAQAWLDAFQSGDLAATRELSCDALRTELTPETYEWTRLAEGTWTFQPERVNGAEAEIEAVQSNGDATLFHLARNGDSWLVCDPFDVQPNW